MNSRRLLLPLIVLALAAISAACATASSTPTADPSPTPEPVTLITEDPNSNPEGFLAAMPESEVACAESAVGGHANLVALISYEDGSATAESSADADADAVVNCLSEETARGILIGQVDRVSGGLSDATVACMADRVSGVALTVMFSQGGTTEADAYLSLFRSIFCLNESERAALETNAGGTFGVQRVGYIDSLQCAFDYRDADGNLVVDHLAAFFASQSSGELDLSGSESREQLASVFAFIPAAVECGVVADEQFEGSGFTAEQLACVSREGGDAIVSLFAIADGSSGETPDLGQLATLMSALSTCGVDTSQIIGDATGGENDGEPSVDIEPTVGVPSFEELDLPLTDEQLACMQSYVSEEDIALMIETAQPPANLFEALDACDISTEQLLGGS